MFGFSKKEREARRQHYEMVEALVLMFEQLHSRQLATIQLLVAEGSLSRESAQRIINVETPTDLTDMIHTLVKQATSETSDNLRAEDFNK